MGIPTIGKPGLQTKAYWVKRMGMDEGKSLRCEVGTRAHCWVRHQEQSAEAAITKRAIHCQAASHVVAEGGNVENLLKTQVSVNEWIFHEARFTR